MARTAKQLANLQPIKKGQLSIEEAKKRSRNGGLKSVEARRAKKTLKEELEIILSNGDTQNRMSLALIEKAMNGDIRAFEVIRDTIGQKPIDKVAQTNTNGEDVEKPLDIEKLKQLKEILK